MSNQVGEVQRFKQLLNNSHWFIKEIWEFCSWRKAQTHLTLKICPEVAKFGDIRENCFSVKEQIYF